MGLEFGNARIKRSLFLIGAVAGLERRKFGFGSRKCRRQALDLGSAGLVLCGRGLALVFRGLELARSAMPAHRSRPQGFDFRSERHLAVEMRIAAPSRLRTARVSSATRSCVNSFSLCTLSCIASSSAPPAWCSSQRVPDFAIARRQQLPCFCKALLDFWQAVENGLFENTPGVFVLVDGHLLICNRLGQLLDFCIPPIDLDALAPADMPAASTFVSSS